MTYKTRIALIPAYEPTELLLSVMEIAADEGFDVITVDDGSGIGYADIFEKAEKFGTVLYHSENMGKGAALKTGFKYIAEKYKEPYTVVTMDADGQHAVADAVNVCRAAEENESTLILGSRSLEQNVPLRSRLGNTITRLVFKASTGVSIYDTQTGLRAFGSRLMPLMLKIPGERYEYEMNVLLHFASSGLPVKEVSALTIYFENNAGSHFNTVRDSYRIYREIFKFSIASLSCFAVDYLLFGLFSSFLFGLKGGLTASNILARIISGGINFSMNRRLVFNSRESVLRAGAKYALLAVIILAGNTLVLNALVYGGGLNRFIAKPLTEIIFFGLSYFVQRLFVFDTKGGRQII